MPDFISLFIEEVNRKKPKLNELFFKEKVKEDTALFEFIKNLWNDLPESFSHNGKNLYAIDASQRMLSFALGPYLFISQGLAIGSNGYEKAMLSLEPVHSSILENHLAWIRDILMQDIEIKLALKIVEEENPPFILFLDGSLLSRLSYLIRYITFEIIEYQKLTQEVLDNTIKLINLAKEKKIELISISKVSRNTFLYQIFSIDHPEVKDKFPYPPTDSEILSIFTSTPGYSNPLLTGGERVLGNKQMEILDINKELKNSISKLPAFATFYVRLLPKDQVLRIDIPAYMIDDKSTLLSIDFQWLKDVDINSVLSILNDNCVSSQIYQTPLYLVDKVVRIKREPDLERYLMILRREFSDLLELDKSQRRFY